jgi:hypothetical protein
VEEVLDRLPNHAGAVVTRDNRSHFIRRRGKIPDAGASVNLDQDLQTIHSEKKGHHEEQNKQLVGKERVAYNRIYDRFQLPAASLVLSLYS